MKKHLKLQASSLALAAVVVVALAVPFAYAQSSTNSQITQAITAGVINTSIRNSSNVVVASPSFAMTSIAASTSQQTATGTFGDNAQRITVDNPGGANNGWTLALNASIPGTSTWTSGANNYAYNGTAGTGQLTVNPAVSTITPVTGAITGVTKGTQATFSGSTPITIMTASAATAPIWNGYLTGVGLSQTIPAGQALGTYTINMTQTVTAT